MQITVTGRHTELADDVKTYVIKKVERLEKYSSRIIEGRVVVDQNRAQYRVEVIVLADHLRYYGESKGSDLRASVDEALAKLHRQMRSHKEKIKRKHKRTREPPPAQSRLAEAGPDITELVEQEEEPEEQEEG